MQTCERYCVIGAPEGDPTSCGVGVTCEGFFAHDLVLHGVTYGYCPP
jgi:hypothetical protein